MLLESMRSGEAVFGPRCGLYGFAIAVVEDRARAVSRSCAIGRCSSGCERERAIRAFVPEEYWEIFADLAHQKVESRFQVTEFQGKAFKPVNVDQSRVATDSLVDATYRVVERESKPGKTRPPAPFITSTLQQAASQRLGFGVKKTMTLAQRLYEAGLITYMRTDSTYLANDAIHAARGLIESEFDARFLPENQTSMQIEKMPKRLTRRFAHRMCAKKVRFGIY